MPDRVCKDARWPEVEQPVNQDLEIEEASRCPQSISGWEPSPGPPGPFWFWFVMLFTLNWVGRRLYYWPWQPDPDRWVWPPFPFAAFPCWVLISIHRLQFINLTLGPACFPCLKLLFDGQCPEYYPDCAQPHWRRAGSAGCLPRRVWRSILAQWKLKAARCNQRL